MTKDRIHLLPGIKSQDKYLKEVDNTTYHSFNSHFVLGFCNKKTLNVVLKLNTLWDYSRKKKQDFDKHVDKFTWEFSDSMIHELLHVKINKEIKEKKLSISRASEEAVVRCLAENISFSQALNNIANIFESKSMYYETETKHKDLMVKHYKKLWIMTMLMYGVFVITSIIIGAIK